MWSCGCVFEGRKEASGLILRRDLDLLYVDSYRLPCRRSTLAQSLKKRAEVGVAGSNGESDFMIALSWMAQCKLLRRTRSFSSPVSTSHAN